MRGGDTFWMANKLRHSILRGEKPIWACTTDARAKAMKAAYPELADYIISAEQTKPKKCRVHGVWIPVNGSCVLCDQIPT